MSSKMEFKDKHKKKQSTCVDILVSNFRINIYAQAINLLMLDFH